MASATRLVCSSSPGSPAGGNQSGAKYTQLSNLHRHFLRILQQWRHLPHHQRTQQKAYFLQKLYSDLTNIIGAPVLWQTQKLQAYERGTTSFLCVVHSWKRRNVPQSFTNSLQHSPQGHVFLTWGFITYDQHTCGIY